MQTKKIVSIALIASIYTVLSIALAPFSFGSVQVRIAEGLVLLPLLYPPSVYGVTLGCFLTNLIGSMMGVNILGAMDIIVGTFATFLAAILTLKWRDKTFLKVPLLSIMSPIVINGIVIGLELAIVLMSQQFYLNWILQGTYVALGELISCVSGYFLVIYLKKINFFDSL